MKILFCASTSSHLKNFHLPYLKAFQERGFQVWTAANTGEAIPFAQCSVALPFCKSFFSLQNVKAIFAARKLLLQEQFDVVSTHTTLASTVVRAAVLLLPRKNRPRVVHTCHGYLFGEGDGLKKWAYLLPEKICAPVTNILMVMNREDYDIAMQHRLYKEKLCFIHGMGLDLSQFQPISPQERQMQRAKLGFFNDDFLFIYAAEFSKRKNQMQLICAFAQVAAQIPQAHLLLAGTGALQESCKALSKELHQEEHIHFLGHVSPMRQLYPLCDASVSTSRVEGLPFNTMEAMACGLPVLASAIKGHQELLEAQAGGTLFKTNEELQTGLVTLAQSKQKVDWSAALKNVALPAVLAQVLAVYDA